MSQKSISVLSWDNLNYSVKTKQGVRTILNNVSGRAFPGELVAIMGASGAGKSTLINALSGRIVGGKLNGNIKFNGEHRVPGKFKRMLAYVEQDDLMHAQLTVEETLTVSAQLRLPNTKYTAEDKCKRVEIVMQQLRLTQVKDTKIGDNRARGVSGGERKRASIGMELVTDSTILVLDEPTTGLDSSSAEMVVSLTKEITRQRNLCTLMTIHQPNAEMVAQFDKLILLAQGKLVYMGPANQALEYFEGLGFPSTHSNPANFYIDLITIDYSSDKAIKMSEQRIHQLFDSFSGFQAQTNTVEEKANPLTYKAPPRNSWWHEMVTLLKRDWLLLTRRRAFVYGFITQCFVVTIVVGFVFFQMGHDQPSAQNRIGFLYNLTCLCVFQIGFPIIGAITAGHNILYRERSAGSYRVSSYLCAKTLSFYPLLYVFYTLMFTGMHFLAHLQYEPGKFFIGLFNMYAMIFATMGMSSMFSMFIRSPEVGFIVALVVTISMKYFASNQVNVDSITPVLRWIKYISVFYYGYSGFMQNEFDGLYFTCKAEDAACFHTGKDILIGYAVNGLPLWLCIVGNLALGVGFYIIAYCLLRWRIKLRYLWI